MKVASGRVIEEVVRQCRQFQETSAGMDKKNGV